MTTRTRFDPHEKPKPLYRPRFVHVVTVAQIPGIDAMKHFEEHKGAALLPEEVDIIQARLAYARLWLERFAPESAVFELQDSLPPEARDLTDMQRTFLDRFADWYTSQHGASGEVIHKAIHDLATELQVKPGQAFQVIYRLMLGRSSGPRAGDLLAALDRQFVLRRFLDAQEAQAQEH
jgi:lysyl-tRNA synthetase class 1